MNHILLPTRYVTLFPAILAWGRIPHASKLYTYIHNHVLWKTVVFMQGEFWVFTSSYGQSKERLSP